MKTSLFLLLFFSSLLSFSQNKYAVIVGINEYYDKPGVKSNEYSLKGCVNDAISMKSLLINRFTFPKENVKTLINAQATQKTFLAAMENILEKSKPGDVAVFFFCGHGVYTINPENKADSIKQGYNQAICMSDLYSPNYECLVRDNTLKILFNRFVEKKVTLTSILDCCYSENIPMAPLPPVYHNPYRVVDVKTNKVVPTGVIDLRSFKLNKTLTIADKTVIERPSETPNSRFANLAACSWAEKAVEIWDEGGRPHGAFTKAIINIFEQSKVDLPLSEIIARIKNDIDDVQNLQQRPGFRYDTLSRDKLNFIGLPVQLSIPLLQTRVVSSLPGKVVVDVGAKDDIMIGNIFSTKDKAISFTISKVFPDSALAVIDPKITIKKDDVFFIRDRYRVSNPIIKIYVPASTLKSAAYMDMFNKQVLPFTKEKTYQDYFNFNDNQTAATFLFNNQKNSGLEISKIIKQNEFFILMAIPSDIAIVINSTLRKEQSLKLVSTPAEADFALYLNYAAISDDNKSPKFVFSFRKPLPANVNSKKNAEVIFWADNVAFPSLNLNKTQLNQLSKGIQKISYAAIRSTGTQWINTYPRR
ncbi:caspase family protein [Pedobacter lithocola]|uniref:Caspase family protein n=1 Tax=Pedobacter lithocola TaxID=1908239 RepID=A0ABV8P6H7_9SPHI